MKCRENLKVESRPTDSIIKSDSDFTACNQCLIHLMDRFYFRFTPRFLFQNLKNQNLTHPSAQHFNKQPQHPKDKLSLATLHETKPPIKPRNTCNFCSELWAKIPINNFYVSVTSRFHLSLFRNRKGVKCDNNNPRKKIKQIWSAPIKAINSPLLYR